MFRKKLPSKKLTTLQITGDKVTVIDGSTTAAAEMTELTHLHSNNTENINGDNEAQKFSVSNKDVPQKYDEILIQDKSANKEDIRYISEILTEKDNETVLKHEVKQESGIAAEALNPRNTNAGKIKSALGSY